MVAMVLDAKVLPQSVEKIATVGLRPCIQCTTLTLYIVGVSRMEVQSAPIS
jgi:hypothetical protein